MRKRVKPMVWASSFCNQNLKLYLKQLFIQRGLKTILPRYSVDPKVYKEFYQPIVTVFDASYMHSPTGDPQIYITFHLTKSLLQHFLYKFASKCHWKVSKTLSILPALLIVPSIEKIRNMACRRIDVSLEEIVLGFWVLKQKAQCQYCGVFIFGMCCFLFQVRSALFVLACFVAGYLIEWPWPENSAAFEWQRTLSPMCLL